MGYSLDDTWQRLITGFSGIQVHQIFPELPPLPLGLIDIQPADLSELTHLIVESAIQDANLSLPLSDCGVVIGSSRGYQSICDGFEFERAKAGKEPKLESFYSLSSKSSPLRLDR